MSLFVPVYGFICTSEWVYLYQCMGFFAPMRGFICTSAVNGSIGCQSQLGRLETEPKQGGFELG
jgi:hypothetical protein